LESIQLNLAKKTLYFLTFISLFFQIYFLESNSDYLCLFLIFVSNIFTIFYCFNSKYFFDYPLSLMTIFISHFINLGGVLFLKSVEFSLLTSNLYLPLSTINNLFLFNITIILGHLIYMKLGVSGIIKEKLINLFLKFKFFEIKNINFLYFLSCLAIISKFLFYDLNTAYYLQNTTDPSIFRDFLNGLNYFIFVPIIIFVINYIQDEKKYKINKFFIFFYFLSLLFIALSRNNRSMMFDIILLLSIVFILLFFLSKIKFYKKDLIKLILLAFLIFPLSTIVEKLSNNFLLERQNYFSKSPIENVYSFIKNFSFSNKNQTFTDNQEFKKYDLFSEINYSTNYLNRFNIIKIHDNFNYINQSITDFQLEALKDIQINKIISIFPKPVIKIFDKNFDKNKYVSFTTASFLYGNYSDQSSKLNIGSALMTLHIIFGNWSYLIVLLCFLPFFILLDSFYISKNNILSPYVLVFLYSTSIGIFNYFSASEIYLWINFVIRTIPQTLIILIFLRFIFNIFFKKFS